MSTRSTALAFVAGIAVSCALIGSLHAQEITGIIRGRAIAADRQPVSGVEVTAQSPALPGAARTRTGTDGAYVLRGLPPGDYVITFSAAGYVLLKRTTRLSARETAAMDAELVPTVGPPPEPIVAVSEGKHMFIRWPIGATTFRTADVYELPLAGTPVSLLTVTPGSRILAAPSLTIWNGVPVRAAAHPFTPVHTLNREALADLTLARGTQPAEFGAPTVFAVAARRGGDRLSGSLLATGGTAGPGGDALWQAGERRAADGTGAASFGGALWPRHLWFFAQGETTREGFEERGVFGENARTRKHGTSASGSLTLAWANRQRLEFDAVRARHEVSDGVPEGWRLADRAGAFSNDDGYRLLSAAFLTQVGRGPGLELRASDERTTASVTGRAFDTFSIANPWNESRLAGFGCSGCGNATRAIRSVRAVARQFMNAGAGSHELSFGAEHLEDRVTAAREPGNRFEILTSRYVDNAGALLPVLVPNGSAAVVWYPAGASEGVTRTSSVFVANSWRAGAGLTLDLGVRWDRVRMREDRTGRLLLEEDGFFPRVALSWQPAQARGLRASIGYGHFASTAVPLAASLFGAASARVYAYTGPAINVAAGPLLSREAAIAAVQTWSGSITTDMPSSVLDAAAIEGRSADAPVIREWSAGVSQQLRMLELRADILHRRDDGGRMLRAAAGNTALDPLTGGAIDAREIVLDDRVAQRSTDIVIQGHYRLGLQAVTGASYTHHRPAADQVQALHPWQAHALGYPEYFTNPAETGFAARHRTQAWMIVQLLTERSTGMLSAGALFRAESSPAYGTVGWIDVRPFTPNPGYVQPPSAAPYVFVPASAGDGGGLWRVDVALRYTKPFGLKNRAQWFFRLDLLNIAGRQYRLDRLRPTVAITALQDPARFLPFNPAVTAPVQGVHWDIDQWSATDARTMPRAIRWLGGFRF
jgi:hypothetical protein